MLNIISKELQMRTIMIYHYTPVRMVGGKCKNWQYQVQQGYRATRTLTHCWWEYKIILPFGKQFGDVLGN